MKRVKFLETIKDCGVPIWIENEIYDVVGGDQDIYYLTTEQAKQIETNGNNYDDTICGIDIHSNKDIIEILGGEENEI